MRFDVEALDSNRCARLIASTLLPRPIAWVTSVAADGTLNAAPFSFFNAVCSWPPVLAIGAQPRADGTDKDTVKNLRATGECTINLVPYSLCGAMSDTSAAHDPSCDELALAGLASVPSDRVGPPRIAGTPVSYECRARDLIALGEGRTVMLLDVVAVHVDDAAVEDAEAPRIDGGALDLVARMHGRSTYARTDHLFELAR